MSSKSHSFLSSPFSQKALRISSNVFKCGNNEEKENPVDSPLLLESPNNWTCFLDSFAKDIITVAVETHKSQHGPSHPVGGASCFVSSLSSQEGGHNCFPKGTDGRSPTLRVGEGASGNLQEPWKMLDTCTCSKQPTSDLMSCFSNTWESQFQVSSLSCWCHYTKEFRTVVLSLGCTLESPQSQRF